MASREKKPLAPSKSKQRANSDSSLSSNEVKNKKGKSSLSIKQQQLAQEIFDTVATGSQLPVKLEASLPRRNALKTLKRRQNVRAAKASLIKSKVGRKVANKSIHRIAPDIKRGVKTKRVKQSEESSVKASADISPRLSENQTNNGDNEGKGTETPSKSAKNNLRTKKTKSASSRSIGEAGGEGIQNKEEASAASGAAKSSLKFGRKGKTTENSDTLSKSGKAARLTSLKKNSTKENLLKVAEGDNKGAKGRKNSGKELLDSGGGTRSNSGIERIPRAALDNKSSIDLTIDEVIASMLGDSELENQSVTSEKIEGKLTRSKKMLVDNENIACDIEIKKEPDTDDAKVASDGEYAEAEQGFQNAIQLRKRSKAGHIESSQASQRSLRNGKQRQLSDSGNAIDKRQRLNSDGAVIADNSIEHTSDCNLNMDSCFPDPDSHESQTVVATSKDEISLTKDETSKNLDDGAEAGLEMENNNNSDRVDRTSETGPTLRSKTKAKTTESEAAKDDDVKTDNEARITSKAAEAQEESKKLYNMDQARKENILAKYADKSKGRRNSLNIENMKRTANSIYSTDKSDGNSLQIDQMIENIKLNIAKSIESKIFSPETGIGLNKNFDVPKIEEIVAPLSTESQKTGLEENTDEDRSLVTKNEITSESSENSVPKVADTAKEIEEKLVMFDIGEAETHSQNIQEDRASSNDRINHVHNICESTCNIANSNDAPRNNADAEPEARDVSCSAASGTTVNSGDNDSTKSIADESNRKVAAPTRKSSRISDKNADSAGGNIEAKKSNKAPNKTVSKSDNAEDDPADNPAASEETVSEDATACCQPSDENATISSAPVSASVEHAEEKLAEEEARATQRDCETENTSSNVFSEEFETLESISRDVERLVADEQFVKSSQELAESVTESEEEISDANEKKKRKQDARDASEQEVSFVCSNDESASLRTNDDAKEETPNKSHAEEKADVLTGTTSEEHDDTSCKAAQSAEHLKTNNNNNHLSTTVNCDSSSECNFVNSVPVPVPACTSDQWDDKAEEADRVTGECRELNKSNDSAPDSENENASDQKSEHNETAPTVEQSSNTSDDKASTDEQKRTINEENRRVLRARDKQKRADGKQAASRGREHNDSQVKVKTEETGSVQNTQSSTPQGDANETRSSSVDRLVSSEDLQRAEDTSNSQNNHDMVDANNLEPQARTRRGRDTKKHKEDLPMSAVSKAKRIKRDLRKSDQQNKEETLLDNEVAKINENNRLFLDKYGSSSAERTDSFHGFFEKVEQSGLDKIEKSPSLRSKSENDIAIAGPSGEERLSRNLSENHVSKQNASADNIGILRSDCKTLKSPKHKDSDEVSTSGESSNRGTPKILETPEDKERKESILRMLGLESLEEAAKRQQKTKKEQGTTGTLKTIIRVSQKDKDKKGSRSPLKMVLKQQQGRGDGEGDSPEFYTIQKEFGTSGLGDSSSGANRKFTTNHRHSCDDDNEETAPKDRQSLVIPEKSSSFSIHPERVCVDVCCYCHGKFGSLDTPMHLAQIKSDERLKKILNVERHITKDSCLCDACYRHVDRKLTISLNAQQKPQKRHRQLMIKCSVRECRDPARHHVKRRWLLKIKAALQTEVDMDWESSQHSTMSFCVSHYEKIGRFLMCSLCKRRLVRSASHQLTSVEVEELNHKLGQEGLPALLAIGTFVCKLCRYFTQLLIKYKHIETMSTDRRLFFLDYRRRVLGYNGVAAVRSENDDSPQQVSQVKDRKTKKSTKNAQQSKSGDSKSPDCTTSGTSEKSTPEPTKGEAGAAGSSDTGNESRTAKGNNASGDENGGMDVQYHLGSLDSSVENLKKRKMLDMHALCDDATTSEMVEILAMDNEVTLTRLPKKARIGNNGNNSNSSNSNSNSNDITPVVQRLGANPSISVRTLFPGEEEMNLHVNIEFQNVREVTPQGWEKCATMIQYDRETKHLWQQLQRPYGNQSSFLRHLILLEKYYRAGDLILAPNASRNAINYSTSVQNRLISYEGPEKMDEPIMEPIAAEYNPRNRLSGGYILEKDKLSVPGMSSMSRLSTSGGTAMLALHSTKANSPRMLKLNSGVSIIKKMPPTLQRINQSSSSSSGAAATTNGGSGTKRQSLPAFYGSSSSSKVFPLNEPDFKRVQGIKRQKLNDRQSVPGANNGSAASNYRSQYPKAQQIVSGHSQQFQKHLRMQQEMLSRQSRGDFEPLICDMTRSAATIANENSQNLIHNLNLPKSIQVTTKPTSNPIPILPKIPKSLTVIPQTVTRPTDK